jgi:hypothetical protein
LSTLLSLVAGVVDQLLDQAVAQAVFAQAQALA